MTELKTLKDIEEDGKEQFLREGFTTSPFVTLKQEAIQDIKEFEKQKYSEWTFLFNPTKEEIEAIIQYIKWKNNITKEDIEND